MNRFFQCLSANAILLVVVFAGPNLVSAQTNPVPANTASSPSADVPTVTVPVVTLPPSITERIKSLQTLPTIGKLLAPVTAPTVKKTDNPCPQPKDSVAGTDTNAPISLQTINQTQGADPDYVPPNLTDISDRVNTYNNKVVCMVAPAADQLVAMSRAMAAQKLKLTAVSGYRSYIGQKMLYTHYAPTMNKGKYPRVAQPGSSEHQLGTAVDIAGEFSSGESFATSPEGKWVNDNAYKYGFVISYPKGEEDKTGYQYEPWHIRYVGPENALVLREANYTLAFKQTYYKQSWLDKLLVSLKQKIGLPVAVSNNLPSVAHSSTNDDVAIGG